jgi:hypothetical protein
MDSRQQMTANHPVQQTAAGRRSCHRRASWPPSLNFGRYAHAMRTIALILLPVLLASCASHTPQHSWRQRLSRYSVGDDARALVSALDAAHYPVRYTPNLPWGEEHVLYFLPTGEIHVMTQTSQPGRTLISAPPFFVADDSPVSDRLARCDTAWDDYVKKHRRH